MTLTDHLRKILNGMIEKVSSFIIDLGLSANHITVIGLLGNISAAFLLARGFLVAGGITAGFNCIFDGLDGTIAAKTSTQSKFGAFLDSTLDRLSEYVLFLGIFIYFQNQAHHIGVLLTYLAFGGSVLVSYIRAKGESLGVVIKRGMLTRVERLIVLVLSLLIGYPIFGLLIIAVIGNLTILQRFMIARKMLSQEEIAKS